MRLTKIKKIHLYVARHFLPMLLMTVFICWFVVLMQFMWQHTEDFVGKGLDMSTLLQVLFHAALMAFPTALPLGVLLASLMTFGGLGERLELLAIKSAGMPLHKVMVSLFVICVVLGGGLFVYLNTVMMESQVRFYQIAFSARQKQPDLEIPEGSFYNGIENYSIFVRKKLHREKLLEGVLIYDLSQGFQETRIIRADTGKLAMDISKTFLTLDLYHGESFQQLKKPISPTSEEVTYGENVPDSYFKEEFKYKQIIIPFDANFSIQSDEGLRNQFVGKNLWQLTRYIQDTARYALDSIGMNNADNALKSVDEVTDNLSFSRRDTSELGIVGYHEIEKKAVKKTVSIDSLIHSMSPSEVAEAMSEAAERLTRLRDEADFMFNEYDWQAYFYRTHDQERHRKFTFPVACILFFFIGAPLGSIIRKGGIGTPMVASVLIFIVYYMIDTYGYKMGYNGEWPVWIGMWLSTFCLLPLGAWLTYQATRDSASLNLDNVAMRLKTFLSRNRSRDLRIRELILHPLSDEKALEVLGGTRRKLHAIEENPFWKKGTFRHKYLLQLNEQYRAAYVAVELMINKLLDRRGYELPVKLAEIPPLERSFSPLVIKNRLLYGVFLFIIPLSLLFICYLYIRRRNQRKKLLEIKRKLSEVELLIVPEMSVSMLPE